MKSNASESARLKAEALASEAMQLEEAGDYRAALGKLEHAEVYVGMWDDPVFETGFYSQLAAVNDRLGYRDAAARASRMAMEASRRSRNY